MSTAFSQKFYRRSASFVSAHFRAGLGALALAVLSTWPLLGRVKDHVLLAVYHWDAYTNAMIMAARVDAVLGAAPLSLYDDYFFAPLPHSIVFNENLFGLSLLFSPFYLLSKNALLAYNLTLLSSLSLAVFFTYLLVLRLTKSGLAGFLVGVAFAFCPYVMFELGRIQLVAVQWIPLTFLFLHRAIEGQKKRDICGFWCSYLLQIGTCLYYAMFLIPLLLVSAGWLSMVRRPTTRWLVQMALAGLVAGGVALLMVAPYFSARHLFDLERSLRFAAQYDGALSFLGNVHPTNRTLTFLHHPSRFMGAYEEIAFPGFVVIGLTVVAVVSGVRAAVKSLGPARAWTVVARIVVAAGVSLAATLLFRSMLAGLLAGVAAGWWHFHDDKQRPRATPRALYLLLSVVACVMFLGMYPFTFHEQPVHGLYYYFHSYFPGFNGIRKVSRQAVMLSFVLSVSAGFGGARVLRWFRQPVWQMAAFSALLLALIMEQRTFPHPLKQAWAGRSVPTSYEFLRRLPARHITVTLPQDDGQRRFVGDEGMAYHNYLATQHKHRVASGQSSWMPQVTELVRRSLRALPHPSATRMLRMVGVRHLLVHGADLRPERSALPEQLAAQSALYRRVYTDGADSVFSLIAPEDPTWALLPTPALPSSARLIPQEALRPASSWETQRLDFALDGSPLTHWSTRVPQRSGHHFEVLLDRPRRVIALEIDNPGHEMYLPLSYRVSAAQGPSTLWPVAQQRQLRLFHDQVYSPKTFVYRIVFDTPVLVDRVRLSVDQPLPGYDFVIHEFRLFEAP